MAPVESRSQNCSESQGRMPGSTENTVGTRSHETVMHQPIQKRRERINCEASEKMMIIIIIIIIIHYCISYLSLCNKLPQNFMA